MSIRATLKVIGNRTIRNTVSAVRTTGGFVTKCTAPTRQYIDEFRNDVRKADIERIATKRRLAAERAAAPVQQDWLESDWAIHDWDN